MRHNTERGGPDDRSITNCQMCDCRSFDLQEDLKTGKVLCPDCMEFVCSKEIEQIDPKELLEYAITDERADELAKQFISHI